VSERDELPKNKRLGFAGHVAVAGLALQLISWGACWFWLYDPVPTYKVIASDYPDVHQSDGHRRMVELSNRIVIATGSDAMYVLTSIAFILLCALCNAGVIASLKRGLVLGIWAGFSTALPLVVFGCFLSGSRTFVHELIASHPEIADWPIRWIAVFR
jgi:hypothetical protein